MNHYEEFVAALLFVIVACGVVLAVASVAAGVVNASAVAGTLLISSISTVTTMPRCSL